MKPEYLIKGSKNTTCYRGYISLWPEINFEDFLAELEFENEIYRKKHAFHVSLVCVKCLTDSFGVSEEQVKRAFENYNKDHLITFAGFTGELRQANKEERKSIVAMCRVSGMEDLAVFLKKELSIKVDMIPFHVTMYTLQEDKGIGINSKGALDELTEIIELPELFTIINSQ